VARRLRRRSTLRYRPQRHGGDCGRGVGGHHGGTITSPWTALYHKSNKAHPDPASCFDEMPHDHPFSTGPRTSAHREGDRGLLRVGIRETREPLCWQFTSEPNNDDVCATRDVRDRHRAARRPLGDGQETTSGMIPSARELAIHWGSQRRSGLWDRLDLSHHPDSVQ
jgi:hypothetical protein